MVFHLHDNMILLCESHPPHEFIKIILNLMYGKKYILIKNILRYINKPRGVVIFYMKFDNSLDLPKYEYVEFFCEDNIIFTESVGSSIRKITEVINSLIKKLVEGFNSLMEKTNIDKTIKKLKKLPKGSTIKTDIDYKKASKTYIELLDGYQDVVKNPKKKNTLDVKTKNAEKTRKALKLGAAVAIPVTAVIGYLELLKHKNNYKNYLLCKNMDDYVNSLSDATKDYPDIKDKNSERAADIEARAYAAYSNYRKAQRAIQESEKFRLILYKDIMSSVKSVFTNVKYTFIYGTKDIKDKNRVYSTTDVRNSDESAKSLRSLTDELFGRS